jgi:hypothetical protein
MCIILFTAQLCNVRGSSTGQNEDTIIELRNGKKKFKKKKKISSLNFFFFFEKVSSLNLITYE